MASPGQPPKTMSSRLMGMKFMQRNAASPTSSPASSSPIAKRAKLNSGEAQATRVADQEAFQAVQAQEDAKREAILDKLAQEAGDTKWVLKAPLSITPSLNVVNAGYGTIDTVRSLSPVQDEEYDDNDERRRKLHTFGRKSYGRFNKYIEKQQNPELSSSSEEEGDEDDERDSNSNEQSGDEEAVVTGGPSRNQKNSAVADELRAKKKAKRRAEARAAKEMASRRRGREIKLNPRMTSISSGGGGGGSKHQRGSVSRPPVGGSCYICGQTDHKAADCPRQKPWGKSERR